MKLFDPNHLGRNNETYASHLLFAASIGFRLGLTGIVFIVHSIIPWLSIPENLNLGVTSQKIYEWNKHVLARNLEGKK